jgi:hypothetical protein
MIIKKNSNKYKSSFFIFGPFRRLRKVIIEVKGVIILKNSVFYIRFIIISKVVIKLYKFIFYLIPFEELSVLGVTH